ncbi:MAG: sodium/solute symporter [Verrucomicrobia bacterium]|nr:sodium/solute symporter [Verrucomicrobiota bacterium]
MNARLRFLAAILLVFVGANLAVGAPANQLAQPSLVWEQLTPLPDRAGTVGAFAGVSGGVLIVAGGVSGETNRHDTIAVLPTPKGEWISGFKLPQPTAHGVSVTMSDGVVCIGGGDGQSHFKDVFRLRWQNGQIVRDALPDLPRPIAFPAGALLGQTIYIAGGIEAPEDDEATKYFWALDLSKPNPRWEELEPWPGPGRMRATAAVQRGAFFLVGGLERSSGGESRTALHDAYRFAPGFGWKRVADLPHAIFAAATPAPSLGPAHFLIVGGESSMARATESETLIPPATVLAYNTIADVWLPWSEAPQIHFAASMVQWNGNNVIPGGLSRAGVAASEVWSFKPTSTRANFGWLNYTTLALYLAVMLGIGVSFTNKNKTTDDFFRGGRSIAWWVAGLSIFATMLSSITFMAIPAQSYGVGWNLYLGNSYLILTPLVVAIYLPFYRKLNVTSAYEYLERRFNTATRMVASTLFILFQIGRVAIVLYLPALALSTVSNLDVSVCILAMGLLGVLYTVMGGIKAVVWTDAAQAIILMVGAIWALVTVIARVDGGIGAVISTASEHGKFFAFVPWRLDYTIGAGWIIIFGSIFTNLFPYTASQDVVQRYLVTKDQKTAARAIWANAFISPFAQALFFAIGTALFVFYRQHPERLDPTIPLDGIFPQFIVRELPAGIAGILVAGIFAAAQSTLSSSLNSVATAYVTDFYRRIKRNPSDGSCLKMARWVTALVGVFGTVVALVLAKSDIRSLWEIFLAVIGLFGGTVSGLFVLGIFTRRATGSGALVGAIVSALTVLAVRQFTNAHFFTYGIIGVLTCVTVGWLASLLRPDPMRDLTGLTVHSMPRSDVIVRH